MPAETRYMRSDTWTVNGLTAYKLGTTQSTGPPEVYIGATGELTAYWGIRVWKRSSAGVETEITGGTPVAVVSRSSDGDGLQNATWSCPETPLNPTDSIVVRLYIRLGTGAWTEEVVFTTEQLGTTILNAATWTVYLYTNRTYDRDFDITYAYFRWGASTYNSRIANFTWGVLGVFPRLNPAIPALSRAYHRKL
jgi:hypothetical protein